MISTPRWRGSPSRVSSRATTWSEVRAARKCCSAIPQATSSSCSSRRPLRRTSSGRRMDIVRDFRRGAVAVHVLHHAAEAPVHGAWLTEELGRHGYRISPGTLYPLLRRMTESGLLSGQEVVVDGRVLRRYRATARGKQALRALRSSIQELAEEVGAS